MDAYQLDNDNAYNIAALTGGKVVVEIEPISQERWLAVNVPCKSGMARLTHGDYLLKDADGFWVVVDESTFLSLYADALEVDHLS